MLLVGDESGALGGNNGSDGPLRAFAGAERATVVSVGTEPRGAPGDLIHLGGGREMLCTVLSDQLRRRTQPSHPGLVDGWHVALQGIDPARAAELEFGNGRVVSAGSCLAAQTQEPVAVRSPGLFDTLQPDCGLLELPAWERLDVAHTESMLVSRALDLRSGLLYETLEDDWGRADSVRFCSLERPVLPRCAPPRVATGR